MKIFITISYCLFQFVHTTFAQVKIETETTTLIDMYEPLPYSEIPEAPTEFTAENVAARMIDGLGYRYYWATESLRPEDLDYKPSEDSRTLLETLDHIHALSKTILNGSKNEPNIRPEKPEKLSWEEKRKRTLENLQMASDLLKMDNVDLQDKNIIFQRDDQKSAFPYWNMLNGPIADALWHAGQVVAFRRAAGNPINPKVNVFVGKTKE